MTETTNYGLKLYEENDLMNPFTFDNVNMSNIDEQMKDNSVASIGIATELKTGTVHAITRENPDAPVFRFTATSNYESGETFTVDNVQVTALLTTGEPLGTGCYIIGSEVLCILVGTRLTVLAQRGTIEQASDSEKLGGHLPEYFATAEELSTLSNTVGATSEVAQTALSQSNHNSTLFTNLVIVRTYNYDSITLAQNESVTVSPTNSMPSTYTPVALVSANAGGGRFSLRAFNAAGTLSIRNDSATTASQTGTPSATVLCIRNQVVG